MKNAKETLFESFSKHYDSKCILNRSLKKIDPRHLQRIEEGISLEDIQEMQRQGLPIYKYKTQITIHGQADELSSSRVHGYAHIFQNKNKSIGIRYGAIDEAKRKRIYTYLKNVGIHYSKNSTTQVFSKSFAVTKENFDEKLTELKELASKIDSDLFYGHKQIYSSIVWGQIYLTLEFCINAIPEANVETFLHKIADPIQVQQAIDKRQKEEDQRNEQYAKERAERQAQISQNRANSQHIFDELDKISTKVEKATGPGVYILTEVKPDSLQFTVAYVYEAKGKKKPRWNKTYFNSLEEVLEFKPSEKFNDNIFSGRITGRKLN